MHMWCGNNDWFFFFEVGIGLWRWEFNLMDEKTTNKRKARDLWVVQGLKWFYEPSSFFLLFSSNWHLYVWFVYRWMQNNEMMELFYVFFNALWVLYFEEDSWFSNFVVAIFIQFDDGKGFKGCHLSSNNYHND
jgi:hypothetical protein